MLLARGGLIQALDVYDDDYIERMDDLMTDKASLFKLSGVPDSFGVILLSFSFILFLAPYFSGADFGVFKIPTFTLAAKRWLKITGPILFSICVLFFLPIISVNNPSIPSSNNAAKKAENESKPELPPSNLSCTNGSLIKAPSKPEDWRTEILTPTNLQVKIGNTLSFSASGTWYLGLGPIGPDGREDWCECTISQPSGGGFRGLLGALIGRIGKNGKSFLIGSKKTITADDDGILYLGSNENMGPCDKVNRGSCYEDNEGTIDVCVEVK